MKRVFPDIVWSRGIGDVHKVLFLTPLISSLNPLDIKGEKTMKQKRKRSC